MQSIVFSIKELRDSIVCHVYDKRAIRVVFGGKTTLKELCSLVFSHKNYRRLSLKELKHIQNLHYQLDDIAGDHIETLWCHLDQLMLDYFSNDRYSFFYNGFTVIPILNKIMCFEEDAHMSGLESGQSMFLSDEDMYNILIDNFKWRSLQYLNEEIECLLQIKKKGRI
jgi:hypothetical protein